MPYDRTEGSMDKLRLDFVHIYSNIGSPNSGQCLGVYEKNHDPECGCNDALYYVRLYRPYQGGEKLAG